MIGIVIGGACGAAEFLLLRALANRITAGKPAPLWMLLVNIILPAAFFLPCGFLWPEQLLPAGIAAACVLIAGGAVQFAANQVKQNRRKALNAKTKGDDALASRNRQRDDAETAE